jgi:hypothetical protein
VVHWTLAGCGDEDRERNIWGEIGWINMSDQRERK